MQPYSECPPDSPFSHAGFLKFRLFWIIYFHCLRNPRVWIITRTFFLFCFGNCFFLLAAPLFKSRATFWLCLFLLKILIAIVIYYTNIWMKTLIFWIKYNLFWLLVLRQLESTAVSNRSKQKIWLYFFDAFAFFQNIRNK